MSRLTPAGVFARLGGVSLALLIFVTPPFQVPDEQQHFYRSYHLSTGRLTAEPKAGVDGAEIPRSLVELSSHFLGSSALHQERPILRHSAAERFAMFDLRLDPDRRVFTPFFSLYNPLPYAPQALAIAGGRAMGVGPLGLLYLARAANALAAGLLIFLALRIFPVGRLTALVITLLPMSQYLLASVSADALTIAGGGLFAAVCARAVVERRLSIPGVGLALLSGALLCEAKVVYAPILFAGVYGLLGAGAGARRRFNMGQIAIALACVVPAFLWVLLNRPTVSTVQAGSDIAAQLGFILEHPLRVFQVFGSSMVHQAWPLSREAIGVLGWINVDLPGWLYVTLIAALLASLAAEREQRPLPPGAAVWWIGLCGLCVLLIELALYLYWTRVGGGVVRGLQGRYFLPLLPFMGCALASLTAKVGPARPVNVVTVGIWAILLGSTLTLHAVLIGSYGLFG
jgi:uncharacterized membrane protein